MKRIIFLLSILCCNGACADTINLHWLNEDGSTYQNSTCVIDSDLILPSTPPTKYGYTFTGWKITNYRPIEYIESTGLQYIDTEYLPKTGTFSFDVEFLILQTRATQSLFGNYDGQDLNSISFDMYSDGHTADMWYQGERYAGFYQFNLNEKYRWVGNFSPTELSSDITTSGGTTTHYSKSITKTYTPTYSTNLMFLNGITRDYNWKFIGKIYEAKIRENGILIRHFIPVLDKDGVPCMFDKVEAKFYYNAGTGNFIAGPAL